jgi:hypothetical protein
MQPRQEAAAVTHANQVFVHVQVWTFLMSTMTTSQLLLCPTASSETWERLVASKLYKLTHNTCQHPSQLQMQLAQSHAAESLLQDSASCNISAWCLLCCIAFRTGLQPLESFLIKAIQLYEMIVVRHGLMLVGQSYGMKTSIYRTLAAALTGIAD